MPKPIIGIGTTFELEGITYTLTAFARNEQGAWEAVLTPPAGEPMRVSLKALEMYA